MQIKVKKYARRMGYTRLHREFPTLKAKKGNSTEGKRQKIKNKFAYIKKKQ